VKTAAVPEQIDVEGVVIFTESVREEVTTIVIALDVEVAGVAHDPDGVRMQVTTLPFASVVVV
jgi:hypothetical protein